MRLAIIFIVFFNLFSCTNKPQPRISPNWFDLPKFIDELVINMDEIDLTVKKTVNLNNVLETKHIEHADSSFWAKELSGLSAIDLNSPQIRDEVVFSSSNKDTNSNLLLDNYIMSDRNGMPLKNISIYYLEESSDIRQIHVELYSQNPIAKSATVLNVWINRYQDKLLIDSLSLSGENDIIMQSPVTYNNTSITVW